MTQAPEFQFAFRKALGSFVTGVTIVTTTDACGSPRGFTANSFCSVSLDPPLILVCLAKKAGSFPIFAERNHFAVNILSERQKSLSARFASKEPNKFVDIEWTGGALGSPILEGAVAWFECSTENRINAGDHIILLGRVVGFDDSFRSPLGYCRSSYIKFSLSQDVAAAIEHSTRVGAILEFDRSVLLIKADDQTLELPQGTRLGPKSDAKTLLGFLQHTGIEAHLDFLFSVFERKQDGRDVVSIYYRGTIKERPESKDIVLVPDAEVPWDRIKDKDEAHMVRRFFREQKDEVFGVYAGEPEIVHELGKARGPIYEV